MLVAIDANAGERIAGADNVVKNIDNFRLILSELTGFPFNQKEVDFFLSQLAGIESWDNNNKNEWNSIKSLDEPLRAIKELGVWDSVEITYSDFIAIVFKLYIAKAIFEKNGGMMDLKFVQNRIDSLKTKLSYESVSDQEKIKFQERLLVFEILADSLENYPQANLEIYKDNKKKIDDAMARMDRLGKEALSKDLRTRP